MTTHSFASEVLHSVTVSPTLTPATFAFVILLLLALLFCYYVSLLFGYFCCLANLYPVDIIPLLTSILLKSDSQFLLCIVVNIFIHKISITFQTHDDMGGKMIMLVMVLMMMVMMVMMIVMVMVMYTQGLEGDLAKSEQH